MKHNVTFSNLKEYIESVYNLEDVVVERINYTFIDGFFTFLRKTKSHNTALKDIDRLKQVILMCFHQGLITANPFLIWKMAKERKEVEFLTEKEINKIATKEFATERLEKVRDVFIFACYTALAYSDLKSLTKENIKTDADGNMWIYSHEPKQV